MPKPKPIELDLNSPIWVRQTGENALWFGRFEVYRLMGSARSLRGCYQKVWVEERVRKGQEGSDPPSFVSNSWRNAFERFRWEERSNAWDAHQQHQVERELMDRGRRDRVEWMRRRNELRSQEWDYSGQLIDKAQAMLAESLHTETEEDGKTTKLPARWSFRDAATMLQLASALRRSATGTEVKELEALAVLVEAGWLPDAVLHLTADRFFDLKNKVRQTFQESYFSASDAQQS